MNPLTAKAVGDIMSRLVRYDQDFPEGMAEDVDGQWVKYEDHAAEVNRIVRNRPLFTKEELQAMLQLVELGRGELSRSETPAEVSAIYKINRLMQGTDEA